MHLKGRKLRNLGWFQIFPSVRFIIRSDGRDSTPPSAAEIESQSTILWCNK